MICTPASLAQEVGLGLGAQAGELKLRQVVTSGGFTAIPARRGDAVQHGPRSAAMTPRPGIGA
jgi:hypothetical protein